MRMPIIAFWGLEMAKKGRLSKISNLEIWFFGAKMSKIDILNPKLIVPDDHQQFLKL